MTLGESFLFVGALLVMLVGLLGAIIPIVPGLPIIWFAALCFALLTNFKFIGAHFLIWWAAITLVITVLQHLFSVYGAKKLGASRWGMVGAFLGMIAGIFTFTIWGVILGPLVGAIAFELMGGRQFSQALRSGFGTFVGFLFGTITQLIASVVLIGMFVYYVIAGPV